VRGIPPPPPRNHTHTPRGVTRSPTSNRVQGSAVAAGSGIEGDAHGPGFCAAAIGGGAAGAGGGGGARQAWALRRAPRLLVETWREKTY